MFLLSISGVSTLIKENKLLQFFFGQCSEYRFVTLRLYLYKTLAPFFSSILLTLQQLPFQENWNLWNLKTVADISMAPEFLLYCKGAYLKD